MSIPCPEDSIPLSSTRRGMVTGVVHVWHVRRPPKVARLSMPFHPSGLLLKDGPEPGHIQQGQCRHVSYVIPNEIACTCLLQHCGKCHKEPHTHTLDKKRQRAANLSQTLCGGGLEYDVVCFNPGECYIVLPMTEEITWDFDVSGSHETLCSERWEAPLVTKGWTGKNILHPTD
jgi:hypothetical protein